MSTTEDYTSIYSILLPKSTGKGIDMLFFADDPELTANAEVLIPHKANGVTYGITVYLMHLYNNEPAIEMMVGLKDRAGAIVEAWQHWRSADVDVTLFCLICNHFIRPINVSARLYRQSIPGDEAHWVDIDYTCPTCKHRMQFSRQWFPPEGLDDMLMLKIADAEDEDEDHDND